MWEPLARGVPEFLIAASVVLGVAWLNLAASRHAASTAPRVFVLVDLALQLVIVVLGSPCCSTATC